MGANLSELTKLMLQYRGSSHLLLGISYLSSRQAGISRKQAAFCNAFLSLAHNPCFVLSGRE